MYEILFDKKALKFFGKIDLSVQKQIIRKLEQLKQNPKLGVPLLGNLAGLWKLRVGKYRVLYRIIEGKLLVLIVDVGHRKNIYG